MKRILSLFTVFLLVMCGCSVNKNAPEAAAVGGAAESSAGSELELLRDYLLGQRDDTGGADFDMDKDGVLDVFDLVLLRQEMVKEEPQSSSGTLVAYFSCTNNTAGIAQFIADHTGADTYVIEPAVPYTAADLDYGTDCRANREQNDDTARPELAGRVDLNGYDTIFLGYPIWWGQAPKIMYTFVENSDLSGKTVIPFCTSGSSPIGTSAKNLSASAPDADWMEGRRFSGGAKESEVTEWVDSLDISAKTEENTMYVTIGGTKLSATLADNSSARALAEMLKKSPITIEMSDYGNFEKVGSLGATLPRNDEKITTEPGDIILYQGSSITIYYDTNTWDFTRLGKINGVTQDELKAVLGGGDVSVTFSIE